MSKLEKFLNEYGHNKLMLYCGRDLEPLKSLLENYPDFLFVTLYTLDFCDDRVFIGKLVSDTPEELLRTFNVRVH